MVDDWDEKTVIANDVAPAAPAGVKRAQLVVLAGASVGELFSLSGTQVLGRGRDADIRVEGDGISRAHARFRVVNDAVLLEDLGSTNGSYVNGEQCDSRTLHDGDKIQLGSATIFRFTYNDDIDEDFQRQMFESASRDALTQIYNKRFFLERLQSEFAYAKRHGTQLSLIIFDLDHFKQINDTRGHLAGDLVLSEIASVIAPAIRSEDVFARYGGEEFVILSRSTEPPAAAIVGERIRSMTEQAEFKFEDEKIAVTVSIGIAWMPNEAIESAEDLIARADKALYEAKEGGRNRVVSAG